MSDVRYEHFVSIIMPSLNEERYVADAIRSVLPPTDALDCELLVVDGGSIDHTCAIVTELAERDPRIRLLSNAKKIQASGVNLAARQASPRARWIVRADCHAEYPAGFVARCVQTLATIDTESVVVPMVARGFTCWQKAVAAAQNSRLGNGGAAHRMSGQSGFVEHGHHAGFDRATFLELGGYDEAFSHNEDAELDHRLTCAGKRIYLDAGAELTYFPRTRASALARQYFNFGRGRASTLLKHGTIPRTRQLAPALALIACVGSLAGAVLTPVSLAGVASYVAMCVGWGMALAWRERSACVLLSGFAAMIMHMSWGAGFLARLAGDAPRLARRLRKPG
jgi:succinoglycan biosynthesis protein ExoA